MLLSQKVYLSTIYRLKQRGGRVRSVELARELNYTKPSISRAIGNFEKEGYLVVQKGGILELTEKGQKEARELDAIGMEAAASKKTIQGMKSFVKEVRELEKDQD